MPEIQDLYDADRAPTGEIYVRGEVVPQGRFRLGVQVWIRNDEGMFLLSQRHPRKKKPLLWEPTGGAVDAGEDTRSAGVREVFEEIGVKLDPEKMMLVRTKLCDGIEFLDTYLAQWNGSLDELKFQENEVVAARWVSYGEMAEMDAQGVLAAEYRELFEHVPDVPAAICRMRMEDYDEVYRFWSCMPGMGLNNLDDSREGVERFLKRNPDTCFVAKDAGGIVGTILCGHDGRRGHLYHAAVSPRMRGRQIGTALVKAALDGLKREGIAKASLLVFADNAAGNRFWEKLGFTGRDDVNYLNIQILEMTKFDPK